MTELFGSFSIPLNISIFGICSVIVWIVGSKLTILADAISAKYHISSSTLGLVFLALATSLPEVATTFTAAVKSYQSLVVNNLFGGIVLQTAVLGIADGFTNGALSNYPRKADHAREAVLLITLLCIVLIAAILGEPVVFFQIGLGSVIVMIAYIGVIWLLRHSAENTSWVPIDMPNIKRKKSEKPNTAFRDITKHQLAVKAVFFGFLILVFGFLLVLSASAISNQTSLGESFVGVTLLAAATSLPEFTTTITAVRMGSYTLAISNIFGSNLIMMALILPADILYRDGPILKFDESSVVLAIVTGMLVSTIYITGLLVRRKPRIGNFGVDSIAVIFVYLLSVLLFYIYR